jgi:alkylhydroperoxidase/carboxymuconolactone decarboxylase family protein YurZ
LLQVAVYAGVPAANSAFAVAKRVYEELGNKRHKEEDQ